MALLSEGQNIRDTYEVERFLGEGAFAEVYRVRHRFLGRQAMKVFKQSGMTVAENEEILSEALMLSRIGHPNIVRVFDANIVETQRGICGYFTMEHVSGGSLERYWEAHPGLIPVATTVDLIKQVCSGLALAHRQNPPVVHRDIKPQNILIGYEDHGLRALVSDFGLAKSVNPLTLLATTAGTPAYKPPEAFIDCKGDSCQADVWGMGVTLYLLLTNRLPFILPQDLGWDSNAFDQKFPPPSSLNPECGTMLDRIVTRALHPSPAGRYANAGELLEALEKWIPEEPPSIPASSPPPPSREDPGDPWAQAIALKESGSLSAAADLMEEAFKLQPSLREKYHHHVKLWRCGISM